MVIQIVCAAAFAVAAATLWQVSGAMADRPEQVPAAFRAVLWLVKGVAVVLAVFAIADAVSGPTAAVATTCLAALVLAASAIRFEVRRGRLHAPEPEPAH